MYKAKDSERLRFLKPLGLSFLFCTLGTIAVHLITSTICACLAREILAPLFENHQWQRWWTVRRQFHVGRLPRQTAGLHQLPAQHCSEVHACTVPYLWCALSEEAPEKVHLRQYVSLLSYCSPEARLDIQHMKTVKQLCATDMTKTTKLSECVVS